MLISANLMLKTANQYVDFYIYKEYYIKKNNKEKYISIHACVTHTIFLNKNKGVWGIIYKGLNRCTSLVSEDFTRC
tara:strand:- start:456 stop:683 length:228 start_codon:yes stop_codon:yes gene_type:complete